MNQTPEFGYFGERAPDLVENRYPALRLTCQWFAFCDNPASAAVSAGPSGVLLICERCAKVVGISLPDAPPHIDLYNGHCPVCYAFKGVTGGECVLPECICHPEDQDQAPDSTPAYGYPMDNFNSQDGMV